MENTCKSFVAAISPTKERAPASTALILGSDKEGFYNDGGVRVFDGDESGARATFNIAGVCNTTHDAVTQNCFKKYCSTEDSAADCPLKLEEQLATMRELAIVAPIGKVKEELAQLEKLEKDVVMQLSGPAFLYGEGKYAPQKKRSQKLLGQLKRLAEPLKARMQKEPVQS